MKMINLASNSNCIGCAACVSICPTNSITMREDKEGFLQPYIDTKTCIGCHKCEKTCPIITPIKIPTDFETQAYAAINKNESVRMRSSSGGMFHALAKWTIEQRGVVFGARFDENWEVVHDYTETVEGIEPFMRSKYVQSRIGDTYRQAKQFLKDGRKVLFVGTPCQIGGLHAFLGKGYNNLVMVDIICHGVPSPKVWREYLKWKVKGDWVFDVNFRDKKEGWKGFQCVTTTTTTTTTTTREQQRTNIFFRGFLDNMYLRRSCYNCQFKQVHRISDITLADYWGIQNHCPEMDDNKGTSAVFIHSERGRRAVLDITQKLKIQAQDVDDIIEGNSMMSHSVPKPKERTDFFMLRRVFSINQAMNIIYAKQKIKRKINKFFK